MGGDGDGCALGRALCIGVHMDKRNGVGDGDGGGIKHTGTFDRIHLWDTRME